MPKIECVTYDTQPETVRVGSLLSVGTSGYPCMLVNVDGKSTKLISLLTGNRYSDCEFPITYVPLSDISDEIGESVRIFRGTVRITNED